MKLDARAFGIAAGVAAAVVSAACALIVAVAPEFATNLFGNVIHLDLAPLARKVTWGNAFGGLVFWGVGVGVVFAFGAWVYDLVARGKAA
jgi:hypothetical protein